MVSLNGNSRQPGQGGMTFFSDSLGSYHDDDPLLDVSMPILPAEEAVSRWMAEEIKKYRTIRTPKAIVLAMFFYGCLVLSAFLLPFFCDPSKCAEQEATSLVLYVHGGIWFLLLLIHLFLDSEHRNSLLHGYFDFHLDTHTLKRAPLFINSAANAILVVVSKILTTVCNADGMCGFLTKAHYLQILIAVEAAVALIALLIYLVKTMRFNKAKEAPDFLRSSLPEETARTQHQIGFRAPFDMQAWAMKQCWGEIYQLRHGCNGLIEERENLTHRLHQYRNTNTVTIN